MKRHAWLLDTSCLMDTICEHVLAAAVCREDCCVQVALYSNVRCLDNTTPNERHIAGMAGIAQGITSQKPAPIAFALRFIQAYQADPGCGHGC